jgi:hypothetical protein
MNVSVVNPRLLTDKHRNERRVFFNAICGGRVSRSGTGARLYIDERMISATARANDATHALRRAQTH